MWYNDSGDIMKEKLKGICLFSIIFLILDQVIKGFISSKMLLNQSFVIIKNFLNITLVHNDGAAFSILEGNRLLLIFIGLIAIIGIFFYLKKTSYLSRLDMWIYSLLIGGVLGNLIDRIIHGYVIDYISVIIGKYYFPVFNFADICIVISVILILITTIREELWK